MRILTSCSGESILPSLASLNPSLAHDVQSAISKYSIEKNKDGSSTPVELTNGFRLLGTPVGSASFARNFYDEQLKSTNDEAKKLTERIPDLHTRLKLFSQCTINKLPHLLDSDVMHNHSPAFDNDLWYNWNGHLTQGIDTIIQSFLTSLLDI